jgi:uncharacterized membrane protein required for colicin V production
MPGWLNPFDVLIVFSVLVGAVVGFARGLVRMLMSVAVLYVAAVLGLALHRPVGNWVSYSFNLSRTFSLGLTFGAILILTFAILNFILRRIYKETELPSIRQIDSLGGLVIGFFVACIWIGFAILVLAFLLTATEAEPTGVQQNVLSYFNRSALVPVFYDFLGVALTTLRPWMPKGTPPELFRIS